MVTFDKMTFQLLGSISFFIILFFEHIFPLYFPFIVFGNMFLGFHQNKSSAALPVFHFGHIFDFECQLL